MVESYEGPSEGLGKDDEQILRSLQPSDSEVNLYDNDLENLPDKLSR